MSAPPISPEVEAAAAYLRSRGFDQPFDHAMVLGTGLGALADDLGDRVAVPYAEIPHFPSGEVSGHAHRLVAGRLDDRRILVFQGRAHFYERGEAGAMAVPIGLVRALGAPPLVLTNAAGSLDPRIGPGQLVLVTDHINLSGANPLIGERSDARFVPMTEAYDADLRARLRRAAERAAVSLAEGVYMWFPGPSFETPAEVRMAARLGADLVGMSTVPEVILARYHGLRVAAVSVVTNLAAGVAGGAPMHAETKAVAVRAADDLRRVIRAYVTEADDA